MPSRTPKWQRKLTAAQRKHLAENKSMTLAALKRNLTHQRSDPALTCFDCEDIARRLGI